MKFEYDVFKTFRFAKARDNLFLGVSPFLEGHVSQVTDFFEYFRVLKWEPTIPSRPSSRGDPYPAVGGIAQRQRVPSKMGKLQTICFGF